MIKKIIIVFLMLISLSGFYYVYNETWFKENLQVEDLEKNIGLKFVVPNALSLSDPEMMYEFISKMAEKNKVNVIRPSSKANDKDAFVYVKYVLLNSQSSYFDNFHLKRGRYLNKSDLGTNLYLSTDDSSDKNQVGVLKSFAGKTNIIIKPFNKCYEFLPTMGTYFLETFDKKVLDNFLNDLSVGLRKYYIENYDQKIDFRPEIFLNDSPEQVNVSLTMLTLMKIILFLLMSILALLYVYYICSKVKTIGIMKLNGLSNIKIWWESVLKFTIRDYLIIIFFTCLLFLFVRDSTLNILIYFLEFQLLTLVFVLLSSILSFIYISASKVNLLIKNKDATQVVFYFNLACKVVAFVLVFLLASISYNKYLDMSLQCKIKNNWAKSCDYGLMYPMHIQNDHDDDMHGNRRQAFRIGTKLYPLLNKNGALFINSHQYEELDFLFNPNRELRYITVNNNYLKEYPVYDANDNKISVDESSKDMILLIPEKLKLRQREIINFFKQEDANWYKHPSSNQDINIENAKVRNRKFKVIWMKDNQKIFSFNSNVFPTENNLIVDPIIKVITENNSMVDEKNGFFGGGTSDPLKIKLINRDVELTYRTLLPYLKEYKLDDSLTTLITADQYIAQTINNMKTEIKLILAFLVYMLSLIFLLSAQNVCIYLNRHGKKVMIKKIFGVGFLKRYLKYIYLILVTNFCSLLSFALLNEYLNNNFRNIIEKMHIDAFLWVALLFLSSVEFIIFIFVSLFIERKTKTKILKEGI